MSINQFRITQVVTCSEPLVDRTGQLYLEPGEMARIFVIDPQKYPDNPYGIRRDNENMTVNFYSAEQLVEHPEHQKPIFTWET